MFGQWKGDLLWHRHSKGVCVGIRTTRTTKSYLGLIRFFEHLCSYW
jgi:hypothetical protein